MGLHVGVSKKDVVPQWHSVGHRAGSRHGVRLPKQRQCLGATAQGGHCLPHYIGTHLKIGEVLECGDQTNGFGPAVEVVADQCRNRLWMFDKVKRIGERGGKGLSASDQPRRVRATYVKKGLLRRVSPQHIPTHRTPPPPAATPLTPRPYTPQRPATCWYVTVASMILAARYKCRSPKPSDSLSDSMWNSPPSALATKASVMTGLHGSTLLLTLNTS